MKKNKNNKLSLIAVFAGLAGILIGIGGVVLTNRQYLAKTSFPQIGIGGGPVVREAASAEQIVNEWPAKSQRVAREIINKYGQPEEMNATRLVWRENSPWKKITVSRDGFTDKLPGSQPKVLEQIVNYRIPDDQFSELVAYDSSVSADRTRGELTARSDSEAMNILIVNLANDLMMDGKPLDQARTEYSELGQKYLNGESVPYAEKLQFNVPPAGRVRDPGETIMR